MDQVADLLHETLEEERAADEKLTEVNSAVLESTGASEETDAEDEEAEAPAPRKAAKTQTAASGRRRSAG